MWWHWMTDLKISRRWILFLFPPHIFPVECSVLDMEVHLLWSRLLPTAPWKNSNSSVYNARKWSFVQNGFFGNSAFNSYWAATKIKGKFSLSVSVNAPLSILVFGCYVTLKCLVHFRYICIALEKNAKNQCRNYSFKVYTRFGIF